MNIHYYEIKNCHLGKSCGKPVLFPPKNTDREILEKYGFVQLTDSKEWCLYLSDKEYQYIMNYPHGNDITFDENNIQEYKASEDSDNVTANTIAGISAALMMITLIGSLSSFFEHYDISLVFGVPLIISVVLAIIVRVIFPENKFGKILMKTYRILVLLFIALLVFAVISCYIAMDSCIDSCCGTAEGCGRIG